MHITDEELIYQPLSYEKRIVTFFDYLAWRNEIAAAGSNERRIGRLAAALHIVSKNVSSLARHELGAHLSSFSDNVVISIPYREEILLSTIRGMAAIQLGAAFMGFLVRGGITIGPLYHDSNIVFGPALVRAATIEKDLARFPRVVLDSECAELQCLEANFIKDESDLKFTSPFNLESIQEIQGASKPDPSMIERFNDATGTNHEISELNFSPLLLQEALRQRWAAELSLATDEEVRAKLSWLLSQFDPR